MSSSNDFDRSFDLFFDQPFSNNTSFKAQETSVTTNDTSFDTTFDSDVFELSAALLEDEASTVDRDSLFPFDPFCDDDPNTTVNTSTTTVSTATSAGPSNSSSSTIHNEVKQPVRIALHEQVTALYDDFSTEGTVKVTGSIWIQPNPDGEGAGENMAERGSLSTLLLKIKDPSSCLQRLQQLDDAFCKLTRDDQGQRSLLVTLDPVQQSREVHIADFYCSTTLRPVPLLIKTKVGVAKGYARVGFKIRANPHLDFVLQDIAILLAVPPDVDGERCKLSRAGGSWEELKRTVSWHVDEIEPGQALEIQAQFPLVEPASLKTPRFPVLVRCNYSPLFCGIEIETADESQPIIVEDSGLVLHRKV